MNEKYQQCTQCVMDTEGNPGIYFDENGVCNFCYEYERKKDQRIVKDTKEREKELNKIVDRIKSKGKKKKYDCIIGVSGGVDSTYTAYYVKKILGLRPLAVHFDNGWNSELAVKNIENTLNKLDIDLYTYVVNWPEFKDLQLSFLKSSTPDGEIPTDHGILSVLFKLASNYNVQYIISGNNFKTEGVLPQNWSYGHIDWKYIKNIQSIFGKKKLKTFPYMTLFKFLRFSLIHKVKLISILNYTDYDKAEASKILTEYLDWRYYGGKHYESKYTKFFQGYILPRKFGIDKRKIHLSALILSNTISRDDALKELEKPVYPPDEIENDKEYVIKKFVLNENKFEELMNQEHKTFRDYPNSYRLHKLFRDLLAFMRGKGIYYK